MKSTDLTFQKRMIWTEMTRNVKNTGNTRNMNMNLEIELVKTTFSNRCCRGMILPVNPSLDAWV